MRPSERIKHPSSEKGSDMDAYADAAHLYARRLTNIEAERGEGDGKADAPYRRVARRLGISPGTMENALRKRLKSKAAWVRDVLRQAYLTELAKEIGALENELEIARREEARSSDSEILEIETVVASLREKLASLRTQLPAQTPTKGE